MRHRFISTVPGYYSNGTEERLTFPRDKGQKLDKIVECYDESRASHGLTLPWPCD